MERNLVQNLYPFIHLELKMILRNKKPLNNLYQIVIIYVFSLLVFIFTKNNLINNSLMFYMIMSLMSASFILGHGIFLLTWESTYFSFIITRKISFLSFFRAKCLLFILSALILSLISLPVLISVKGNLLIFLAFLMFNIGVLPIIIVTVSLFNNERASLDKNVFFNYEGYGIWQYIFFIIELMLPGIIFFGFSIIWSKNGALFILFLSGIIGIILFSIYPKLFFLKRKYKIILGFNQK